MRDQILSELSRIEREYGVSVLFAIESGSRAWGFASADSDWDVRFIYVRPLAGYVTVSQTRDVIEEMLPGDLDLAGWDLRKALLLFQKSNPSMLEWLRSPIQYRVDEEFMDAIRGLEPAILSLQAGLHHYSSMTVGTYDKYLRGETVSSKKYLYALRTLLSAQYIEGHQAWPPIEFPQLVDSMIDDPAVRTAVDRLLVEKRSGTERGVEPRDPVLHPFIEQGLDSLGRVTLPPRPTVDYDALDRVLRHFASRTVG
ncbi:MAG: nucleotidyltransferase domain-containing protein [Fimbriimonadaceae bacterium]|nr:nucleotidyltransferase domain-containing protein [Fimbriimonadaceae bacterium]